MEERGAGAAREKTPFCNSGHCTCEFDGDLNTCLTKLGMCLVGKYNGAYFDAGA